MTSVFRRSAGCVSCSSLVRPRLAVPSDSVSTVITGEIEGKGDRVRDALGPAGAVGV